MSLLHGHEACAMLKSFVCPILYEQINNNIAINIVP